MDFLKTLWPTPFKIKPKNVASFLVQLLIFVVVVALVGVLIGILKDIPIIGWVFGIVGSLIGIYNIVGIVLCILVFADVLK